MNARVGKRIFSLLMLIGAASCSLYGEIIETDTFAKVTNHLTPTTLLVVDIDDTLLLPVQALGTDVWFMDQLKKHSAEGLNYEKALDKALAEWEAVRHLTEVRIVEKGTEGIIKEIQASNITVMGLTTQGLALAARTVVQLKSLDIDLSLTAPSSENVYFVNGREGVLYRHGILFTSGTNKGNALKTLLERIDFHPDKIVFINDKKTHLNDLEKGVNSMGIEFIGLRYSHEDVRVANFNNAITDIQWAHSTFGHILSDEEAQELLNQEAGVAG